MGHAFGDGSFNADFSDVKVHTDSQSNQLNQSIQARAFTTGRDIFFRDGAYNPDNSAGQELLAHELTHVVQQTGGQVQRSHLENIKKTDQPVVQRWNPFKKKQVEAQVEPEENTLNTFEAATQYFKQLNKSRFKKGGQKKSNRRKLAADYYVEKVGQAENRTTTARDIKMAYQTTFNEALLAPDIEVQEKAQQSWGSIGGAQPDFTNDALQNDAPDKFKITLAVSQTRVSWLKDIKALRNIALKSPKGSFKAIKGDLSSLAKKVLSSRGKLDNKTEEKQQQLINEFTGGVHDVGHTWVRLGSYVGNALHSLYSYGFYPQQVFDPVQDTMTGGYGSPTDATPGQVRHPDIFHEDDPNRRYIDYEVDGGKFQKALTLAQTTYQSPPPYTLMGFNCTSFARDVIQSAGLSFAGGGLRVLHKRAWTPGKLYAALQKESQAYGDKDHADPLTNIIDTIGTGTESRQKEGLFKMKTAQEMRIPHHEVHGMSLQDMIVLYTFRKWGGKGTQLDIEHVVALFKRAGVDLLDQFEITKPVSMNFLGRLGEVARARLGQHLGMDDNELHEWRESLGETTVQNTDRLNLMNNMQGVQFSDEEKERLTYMDMATIHTLSTYHNTGGIHAGTLVKAYTDAGIDLRYLFILSSFGKAKLAELLGMTKVELNTLLTNQDDLEKMAVEEDSWADVKTNAGNSLGLDPEALKLLTWKDVAVWYALNSFRDKGDQLDFNIVTTKLEDVSVSTQIVAELSDLGIKSLAPFLNVDANDLRGFFQEVAEQARKEEREKLRSNQNTIKNARSLLKPKLGFCLNMISPRHPIKKNLVTIKSMAWTVSPQIAMNLKNYLTNLTEEEQSAMAQLLEVDVETWKNEVNTM